MDKEKFQIEYLINASAPMLYNYIATPSGLSEWFADNVNSRGEVYTFIWEGSEETAIMQRSKKDSYVRFQWESDEDTKYYFEIKIVEDELTGDMSLVITDFAEEDELEEAKLLWNNLLDELSHVLGS